MAQSSTRLFRVRVTRPGVARYSYLARGSSSFQCWNNAFQRILENSPNAEPFSVSVMRCTNKAPVSA